MQFRALVFAFFLTLLVPAVSADHDLLPMDDGEAVVVLHDGEAIYYLTVCRNETPTLTGCLASGLWKETNELDGLQTRAGLYGGKYHAPDQREVTLP